MILDLFPWNQGLFWVRSEMGMCDWTVAPQGNHKRPTKKGLKWYNLGGPPSSRGYRMTMSINPRIGRLDSCKLVKVSGNFTLGTPLVLIPSCAKVHVAGTANCEACWRHWRCFGKFRVYCLWVSRKHRETHVFGLPNERFNVSFLQRYSGHQD